MGWETEQFDPTPRLQVEWATDPSRWPAARRLAASPAKIRSA